jgi:hypothetical protein
MTVESGFDSRHGISYSLETIPGDLPSSYPAGIGGAFPGGQCGRGRANNYVPPHRSEVKKTWNFVSTIQLVSIVWCVIKHRDIFPAVLFQYVSAPLPPNIELFILTQQNNTSIQLRTSLYLQEQRYNLMKKISCTLLLLQTY